MSRGILAGDPLRLAAADGAECAAQIGERAQAEADLQQRREAQRQAEKREGDGEREDEVAHRRVDLVGGAGDADDVTSVLAEIDVALDDAQGAVVGRLAVAAADLAEAVVAGRSRLGSCPPKRDFEERISPSAALGRATCQYQPDSGSSKRGIADGAEVPVGSPGPTRLEASVLA